MKSALAWAGPLVIVPLVIAISSAVWIALMLAESEGDFVQIAVVASWRP